MNDFFTNYFLPYWTQVLVFLSVVGYLFSRSFSNRDQRAFKLFEIFQEEKLRVTINVLTALHGIARLIINTSLEKNINNVPTQIKNLESEFQKLFIQFREMQSFYLTNDINHFMGCFESCGDVVKLTAKNLSEAVHTSDVTILKEGSTSEEIKSKINKLEIDLGLLKLRVLKYYKSNIDL